MTLLSFIGICCIFFVHPITSITVYHIFGLVLQCRRHPTPTREMLEPLLRTAAAIGLSLDVSSSKALADSLDRAVVSFFLPALSYLHSHCLAIWNTSSVPFYN